MRLPLGAVSRRAAALAACAALAWPARELSAGGVEEIRKAASILPGMGPPDIIYPPAFTGRWRVTQTLADVQTPLGPDKAPADAIDRLKAQPPVASYDARFVAVDGGAIADRAFNAVQREAALARISARELSAAWEPSNPNVLTITRGQTVTEVKVTKRAVEAASAPNTFGSSEYARVADAGSSGPLGAVPLIRATRVQARYKWEGGADGSSPARIDALEIASLYDPTATGFADLAGASPVVVSKSRLTLERDARSAVTESDGPPVGARDDL